jgi:hypothetical protein
MTAPTARLLSAMAALLALGFAERALAEEQLGPLLVLVPAGSAERGETLGAAMSAHLSGYSVEVRQAPIEALPDSFPAQAEAARRAVSEHDGLGAIWIDERHGMLFVLVAAPEGDQILQRPLPGADEPWRARCDAVASMVHSALAPWLERDQLAEPATTATEGEDQQPEPAQLDDPEKPFDHEPDDAPEAPATEWLLLQLRLGYGPVIVNSSGSIQHGGRIGVGFLMGDHLEAEVALDLLFPLPAEIIEEQNTDIALVRWPLRVAAAGFITALDLDIGVKIGLVIDFTHVRGVDEDLIADDTRRTNPGFAATLFLRYRILDWLAIWAEGGIDVYSSAYDYNLADVTVIRYSALQGRISGGLAALFTLI